jgi:hypothetical protein
VDDKERQNDPRAFERRLAARHLSHLRLRRRQADLPLQPAGCRAACAAVSGEPHRPRRPHGHHHPDAFRRRLCRELCRPTRTAKRPSWFSAKSDYEKKFFSDETNASFVACFLDHARRDPMTGEVGKTICSPSAANTPPSWSPCSTRKPPGAGPKPMAPAPRSPLQVTSDHPGAQQMTIDFANNNLNGKSQVAGDRVPRLRHQPHAGLRHRRHDDHRLRLRGRPQCGADPAHLLATDFIQIKGRGTRLFTFKHGEGTGKTARRRTASPSSTSSPTASSSRRSSITIRSSSCRRSCLHPSAPVARAATPAEAAARSRPPTPTPRPTP